MNAFLTCVCSAFLRCSGGWGCCCARFHQDQSTEATRGTYVLDSPLKHYPLKRILDLYLESCYTLLAPSSERTVTLDTLPPLPRQVISSYTSSITPISIITSVTSSSLISSSPSLPLPSHLHPSSSLLPLCSSSSIYSSLIKSHTRPFLSPLIKSHTQHFLLTPIILNS